nr:unnamed protein product [Digitaria exilis]
MMGLSDIRDLVSSLFIMLNKTEFILFRIEFLVVLVTFLFLAMFIMDIFRRFIHSSIMKAIFSLFDAVSDSIVIYLLGAMQTAPFKNQLLPVWALVLVTFRHNIDFISGYGVTDRGGRRLLRCRFEDVMLPKDMYFINRELIKTKIIEEQDAKRAFRVMELQLAYVNDYFNTRYPMVFWWGLRSLGINLLQSVVTIGVVLWLSIDIRRVYKPPDGELAHLVQEVNVDIIITWVFMFFMTFKEILEMSYDDRPKVWNWFHTVTTGLVPKKEDGAKLGSAHPVPDCVLSNIREKLNVILEQAISEKPTVNPDINSDDEQTYRLSLPGSINALSETNMRYDWALQLETSSEIILVWHIATSFCEMELANNYNVDLSNPGYNKLSLEAYKAAEDPRSVIAGEEVVKQEAHKNCLESGGEFITIIWALLWHCGIEKSKLWQEDDASENNATTDIHASDAGNNINNAGIDTTNHQTRSNVPEMEEDIETGAGQENAPKRVK